MQEQQKIPGTGRSPGGEHGNPSLSGESHGQRSLAGYSLRGHKESDTTQQLSTHAKSPALKKQNIYFFWSLFLSVKKKPSCLLACRRPLAETRPANCPFFSFLPWTLCFPSENGPVGPQKQETESFSCFSCVWLFAAPWSVAHQAPLSMGLSREGILEWIASLFSTKSSQPRGGTQVSRIAGRFFTVSATTEAQSFMPNAASGIWQQKMC